MNKWGWRENFPRLISAARTKFSTKEIARMIGVSKSSVNRWEKRKSMPHYIIRNMYTEAIIDRIIEDIEGQMKVPD